MALIPTRRNRYYCFLLFAINSPKFLFLIILHIGFCFTIWANNHSFALDSCTDTDKPVITIDIGNCTPAVFSTTHNSCVGYLAIKASATDDQTTDELLSYSYKIDLYNDGKGVYNGFDFWVGTLSLKQFKAGMEPFYHDNPLADNNKNTLDASGTYPIGIHKICWYVADSCGNTGALCALFEVKDCEAPVVNCVGGIQIYQMTSTHCITLLAKDFNVGSFDNCTPENKLICFFNGDPTATSYTICCDDFVAAGVNDELSLILNIWVQDEEGNADYCQVICLVLDNLDVCGCGSILSKVEGQFRAIKNRNTNVTIPDIEASLYLDLNLLKRMTTYDKNNNYLFGDLKNGTYILNAKKYTDSLNSVSTLDLIYFHRHLLKIDTFSNPLQYLSGDINHNGICNASDISEIRKLILGTSIFAPSKPWIILPMNIDSNTISNQNENIEIKINASSTYRNDFRVIKMGDVNDFVSPYNYKPLADGTNDSLIFSYKNQLVRKGEIINIDLYAEKFNSIVGFQGTFKFDNQKLLFHNIGPAAIIVDINNIGIKFIKQGFLTMSWYDVYPRSYSRNTILFNLEFEVLEDGDLCDALSFTSDLTPAEAYTDSVLIKNIKIESCDVILSNNDPLEQNINIYPNPFKDILQFGFTDKVSFPIQLSLYDQNGRQAKSTTIHSNPNQFSWNIIGLQPGIYFIKLSNDRAIAFKKIVKL